MSAVPKPQATPRLKVSVAVNAGRTRSLLQACLQGMGRQLFTVVAFEDAECLIADYDHPQARHDLQRFRARYQRPAIVLATRNPGLPGTVWVAKPLEIQALRAAAGSVRILLATPPGPRPHAQGDEPAPSLPPLALVSRSPAEDHERAGPFKIGAPPDWTAKIGWMTVGVLGITALSSALGWRPAADGWRPATADVSAEPPVNERLKQAVQAALQEPGRLSAAEQSQIDALLADYRQSANVAHAASAWSQLTYSAETFNVSAHALPVALMAVGAPNEAKALLERQLRSAVNAALAP